MAAPSFAAVFFRLYDRKIASGEITFSSTGIKKSDFTKLCVESGYVFDDDTINRICETMHLTLEEEKELRAAGECNDGQLEELGHAEGESDYE